MTPIRFGLQGMRKWSQCWARAVQTITISPVEVSPTHTSSASDDSDRKVTVVGAGRIGSACAYSLIIQGVTNNVVVLDESDSKLIEVKDIQHGMAFKSEANVIASTDFSQSLNSRIVVVSAGAARRQALNRVELLGRNVILFKKIIPELVKYSPDAIFVIVTQPVDVLTYTSWKISGRPLGKVFGIGTNLDTAKLKLVISNRLGLNIDSVQMWVIGEQGDTCVPIWSSFRVGGVDLKDHKDPTSLRSYAKLRELYFQVQASTQDVLKLKGRPAWAVSLNVAQLCRSILDDNDDVYAVSTLVKGIHGVGHDVFLSLPAIVGSKGLSHIIPLVLSKEERKEFNVAAQRVYRKIAYFEL